VVAHGGLVAACVLLPLAETTLLLALGLRGAVPTAPAVTAPAPYGVFHDLRFLLVYHSSWAMAAAGTLALLVWRTLVEGALDRLAWPRDLPRPRFRELLGKGAVFTAVSMLLLTPATALLCGMALAPVSYLFLAAIPVVVIIAALLPHGGVTTWWSRPPPARAVAWSLLTFAALTAAGMLLAAAPTWAVPLPVAACGLFNAWARQGIANAIASYRPRRALPLVPASFVLLSGLVVVGTTGAVRLLDATHHTSRQVHELAGPHAHPVLLITGYGTRWDGRPPPALAPGLSVTRFSYTGLTSNGRPRPFPASATDQPLNAVVRLLSDQVDALHRGSGQPVALVGSSEGSLAAQVCPPRGVPTAALVPLADAVATPYSAHTAIPVGVVARLHGVLLDDGDAARTVALFLETGRPPALSTRVKTARLVQAAAAAWQVPSLKASLVPPWRGEQVYGCTSMTESLRTWLGP
jgi:hypothetical protein